MNYTDTVGRRPLLVIGVASVLSGCLSDEDETTTADQNSYESSSTNETGEADQVDYQIRTLLEADDRERRAEELDIEYDDGVSSVLIRLTTAEETPPAEYIHSEINQHDDLLFAYVHLDDIESLAAHETVEFVQLPPRADEEDGLEEPA